MITEKINIERSDMKEINALRLRNHLGEIIEELNTTGEPVLISKARKIRAVLITPDQYERRFLDYQAEEKKKKILAEIAGLRAERIGAVDSVEVLREMRGYNK
jgi:PHD/YefM family antitoxin component YafN of YafNO toxin-antitoxin module